MPRERIKQGDIETPITEVKPLAICSEEDWEFNLNLRHASQIVPNSVGHGEVLEQLRVRFEVHNENTHDGRASLIHGSFPTLYQ